MKEEILKKLQAHTKYETLHDTEDIIECEVARIQNIGFEEAHRLRGCGHSVGDYRDEKYNTKDYDGDEKCVACKQVNTMTQSFQKKMVDEYNKQK